VPFLTKNLVFLSLCTADENRAKPPETQKTLKFEAIGKKNNGTSFFLINFAI
jgi:hypothetical protein